jgi:hypothetical protein
LPPTEASPRTIAAIQLAPTESGERTLGVFTQLPSDAVLTVCDDRCSEKTVKVSYNGIFYLVFREDLESRFAVVMADKRSQRTWQSA